VARKRPRSGYDVYLDAKELGGLQHVGVIRRHDARADVPASFEYAPSWLRSAHAFMLDPRLALWKGEHYPPAHAPAFGVFMDSAPDRWGRVLMERRAALASRTEGRAMRTLHELDFLLGVHDLTRTGALRFRSVEGGPYLDDSPNAAPPITSLPELAAIVRRLEEPGIETLPEYARWLAILIAPGTSLGGARPKASFTDGGGLWIAKFPARDDRYDVGGWELVVHRLAARAGIDVPASRLERIGNEHGTFCVSRFDRIDGSRRMFVSAMTLLDRADSTGGSYLDLAQLVADHGAASAVATDLAQLFRRAVFNVLVGNRDDHLRNHGFVRVPTGWRLAPAYDMNPNPFRSEHVLSIDGRLAIPDVALLLETADLYRLTANRAREIVKEVRGAVAPWAEEARRAGLRSDEVSQMQAVFQT
jgi:serine/threonine-protein kinase HipA